MRFYTDPAYRRSRYWTGVLGRFNKFNIYDKEAIENFIKQANGYDLVKQPIGRGYDWAIKKIDHELKIETGPTQYYQGKTISKEIIKQR